MTPTFRPLARRQRRSLLAGLLLLVTAFVPAREWDREPDVLVPARGREVEGYLVRMDDERVHFQVETRDEFFAREEVETIRSPLVLYPEFADRLGQSRPGDRESAVQLARWCQDVGLELEAEYAWWRVLAYDWNDAEAHEALGSKEKSKGWQVKIDRRYYYRDKLYKRVEDWKTALELDLALFKVRSSARLEDTLDAMSAMVTGYMMVYELFGDLMQVPYPREYIFVHLHGDSKTYPPLNKRSAYFEAGENRIVADTTLWDGPATIVHEMTHALLANAYKMIDDNRGSAPAWLTEGMAEHVAAEIEARMNGVPSRLETPRAQRYLEVHALAEEPVELNRLLVAALDDFHDLGGSEEFYAQAFTLVLFLMDADEEAYRSRFETFLRGTYEGKSSPTHFEEAMADNEMEEFEERWHAWVRGIAPR
ncbi:MAG: DUF1570 domain-containing protein [Planctomycetota bacterium]|jgi:hypothetical protein